MLKNDWGSGLVVSYSDKEYGHSGTIYKASNFKQDKDIPGARVIMYNGKRYHDKTIRTKYKGVIKPYAQKIKDALESGDAFYKKTKGKCTFVYKIGGTKKPVDFWRSTGYSVNLFFSAKRNPDVRQI